MQKISEFIVKKRIIILVTMLLLTVLCGLLIPKVTINTDMTKYLPDDSSMKIGMDLMEQEFPDSEESYTIRVMFKGLPENKKLDIKKTIEEIQNVDSVTYEADDSDYNKDDYTLYTISTKYDYSSSEEAAIESSLFDRFADYDITVRNDDTSSPDIPPLVIILAFAIMLVILFIACDSFFEPLLYLITIGIAIVMNLGTNIILGEISDITSGISAILQLVLSMDYSIILMNRYRQELKKTNDKECAMTRALTAAVGSITGSSITTIVGLIVLVFMSFKIGADLGIVLAKGVALSMICVFTVLSALIVMTHKLIMKTTKKKKEHSGKRKDPMAALGSFSYRFRKVIAGFFVLLFIGTYFLQTATQTAYTLTDEDPIADVFAPNNPIVMLYETKDDQQATALAETLENNSYVKSATSYATTLGKPYTAVELVDVISDMGSDMDITAETLNIIYYDYYKQGKTESITVSEFIHFIAEDVVSNKTFSNYLDKQITENIDAMLKFADSTVLTKSMTADEIAAYFEMEPGDVKQLLLYYYSQNGGVDSGHMTIPAFADFIINEVATDDTYSSMFDADTLSQMDMLKKFTDAEKMTTPCGYQEIASILGMDQETAKLLFVYYYAMSDSYDPGEMTVSDFVAFLKNDVASNAAFASYFDEATLTQMGQISTFTDSATIQKQMTSTELAAVLGMDDSMVNQLFSMYFGAADAKTKAISLCDFMDFLVGDVLNDPNYAAYFDDTTKSNLTNMQQLVSIAASGRKLTAGELSACLGMEEAMVAQLFAVYSGSGTPVTSLTLTDFTAFMVNTILPDEAYAAYFSEETKSGLISMHQIVTTAVSGQTFSATQMAGVLGVDESMTLQLYTMYFGKHTSGKTMSLLEFVDYILSEVVSNEAYAAYFNEGTIAQLQMMQYLMQSTVNGTEYTYQGMGTLFGMDSEMTKMLYTYRQAQSNVGSWMLSAQTVVNFIANNSAAFGDMLGNNGAGELNMLKNLINGSVAGTPYTATKLASVVGMDASQIEQLYLLYISKHGDTSGWKLSVQQFVDFINSDVLTNKDFANQFSESDALDLQTAKTVIDAVVSENVYTSAEIANMFGGLAEDMNSDTIELMYLYYASTNNSEPTWTLSINQMFDYLWNDMLNDPRFTSVLDAELRADIADTKEELDKGIAQLRGKNYSLLVLSTTLPGESEETTEFFKELTAKCDAELDGEYYLIGNSAMVYEMENTFDQELLLITLLTAISIFVVVAFTFKSFIIPLILVLIVQSGVFITVSVIGLQGLSIYYLALLIVECILMGATIDYGILFTSYYREMRDTMDIKNALIAAYKGSIHTILTSGSIMVLVTALVGRFFGNPTIEQIVSTVSIGCLSAIILILFILPGILALFDKWVIGRKNNKKDA